MQSVLKPSFLLRDYLLNLSSHDGSQAVLASLRAVDVARSDAKARTFVDLHALAFDRDIVESKAQLVSHSWVFNFFARQYCCAIPTFTAYANGSRFRIHTLIFAVLQEAVEFLSDGAEVDVLPYIAIEVSCIHHHFGIIIFV